MVPESVKVGYVRRAHGIKGAVIVKSLIDDPDLFVTGGTFATDRSDLPLLRIGAVQGHKDGLLISFDTVADRNAAEAIRGTSLLIEASRRRELGPDEFWPDQLVGLTVLDSRGTSLGTITDISHGPQDRLVVSGAEGIREVPFVAAIVTDVDIENRCVVVDPPEGLFD